MTDPTTTSVRSDWVTFLSDYGLDDHLVGVCKGVIARIAPHVRIIDVCHQVRAQDVTMGGEMLAEAWPYLPTGIHLALVDPFTATHARGVAVLCRDGSVVVAPDNGLASRAWEVAGGVAEAYELAEPSLWAGKPSRSFRGRDVFAPVAAHLARGVPLDDVGPGSTRPRWCRAATPSRGCTATTCTARSAWSTTSATWRSTCARSDLEAAGHPARRHRRAALQRAHAARCPFTLTLRRGAAAG